MWQIAASIGANDPPDPDDDTGPATPDRVRSRGGGRGRSSLGDAQVPLSEFGGGRGGEAGRLPARGRAASKERTEAAQKREALARAAAAGGIGRPVDPAVRDRLARQIASRRGRAERRQP